MQLAALDLPPFRILRIVRGRCMAQLAGEDSLAVAAMRQHMPSYVDAAKAVKRFAKRVRLAGNDAMAVQALLDEARGKGMLLYDRGERGQPRRIAICRFVLPILLFCPTLA